VRSSNRVRQPAPVSRRSGFTLVELLVALAVGGVAILGARSVLGALADHADRVSDAAASADRDANGERTLRALLGSLEIGTAKDVTFGGDEREARFRSWCASPSGWQERCTVRLGVVTADSATGASILTGVLAGGESVTLMRDSLAMRLRYLRDAANGGTWFRSWGAGITAPVAIGIIRSRDTIIVRVGERG
jgi:prepilin-type N-terminal cleavage/methylation domain-containing protein